MRPLACLFCLLLLTACAAPASESSSPTAPPEPETAGDVPFASLSLETLEPYQPWQSQREPDEVPANTMGDVLCEKTLPDGTEIVCYWEPDTEYTKYWAVRRGDSLLRFCEEESGYNFDYDVDTFSGVLGHDGFRILCPRGAAYNAYDYYYLDKDGVPRILAACANFVLEPDLDGDGQRELLWIGGGTIPFAYSFFQRDGMVYQAEVSQWLNEALGDSRFSVPDTDRWAEGDYSVALHSWTNASGSTSEYLGEGFLRFETDSIQFFLPADLVDRF